jgi:hypothetical protein
MKAPNWVPTGQRGWYQWFRIGPLKITRWKRTPDSKVQGVFIGFMLDGRTGVQFSLHWSASDYS